MKAGQLGEGTLGEPATRCRPTKRGDQCVNARCGFHEGELYHMIVLDQTHSGSDHRLAEIRRRALRQVLDHFELTPADLARKAGLPNPNAIYNLLNGHAKSLSISTYQKLAQALPGTTVEQLSGVAKVIPATQMEWVALRGSVRAGHFMSKNILEQRRHQIAVPPMCVGSPDSFGMTVDDTSCDQLYRPGTVLVLTPFADFQGSLAGKKALVYRQRQGKIEATIREIEGDSHGVMWLWFRSTDPRHQGAVPLPARYHGGAFTIDTSGDALEVAGIVTYSMRPEV